MKSLSIAALSILSVFATVSSFAADTQGEVVRLLVPSMSCVSCSSSVTSTLKKLEGVSAVTVDLEHKVALIDASAKMDNAKIKTAMKDAGYEVTKINRSDLSYKKAKAALKEKTS